MSRRQEYIDSVDGNAHQKAVEIIAELEQQLAEAHRLLNEAANALPREREGLVGEICAALQKD